MNVKHRKMQQPGLLLLLIVLALFLTGCGAVADSSEGLGQSDNNTYEGIQVGFTDEGYPYLGDPNAPVILEEYSDFLCPYCSRHFEQTVPVLIEQYVKTGQVLYVFHDLPLESLHPTAPIGHAAGRCVAEQGASFFWSMHDQLFTQQKAWSSLADPSEYLGVLAESAGAKKRVYENCINEGATTTQVQESIDAGKALGFTGTPAFRFVVGETGDAYTLFGAYPVAEFATRLDALLAGEPFPVAEEPEPPEPAELPYWANSKGLAPDQNRPGFNMAGDPYKGNPEAELVVIEFSDFQCPACQQHALEVQPVLDEALINTGAVLWVFKNLPLQMHPNAPAAAVAAECAGEQGSFWEMHHLLYERVEDWSNDAADAVISSLASELELNTSTFESCYNSRQAMERVLGDIYDAQGLINSTPNFIILQDGRGTLMETSLSSEQFVAALQDLIDSAKGVDQ